MSVKGVKAILPMLLLLLVAGQMSGEVCGARCENMSAVAPICVRGMAHGHCPLCDHASANGARERLSTPETCCGQICKVVFGQLESSPDQGRKPLVIAVSIRPTLFTFSEDTRHVRFGIAQHRRPISPFDPLTSTLRI